jgi:hypothetical protein
MRAKPTKPNYFKTTMQRRARPRKESMAIRTREAAEARPGMYHGTSYTSDRAASGQMIGLYVHSHRVIGQAVGDPGVAFAYRLRRQMRPIKIAPTTIYDGDGKAIARVEIDSVTGKRSRIPLEEPRA